MSLDERILAAQDAALRAPWSNTGEARTPEMIQFTDRVAIGLSLNK